MLKRFQVKKIMSLLQSVFSPYMSEHVKRCLMRSQTIFGVLIPSDRFSLFASMKASMGSGSTGSGSGEQQHNVIRYSMFYQIYKMISSDVKILISVRASIGL